VATFLMIWYIVLAAIVLTPGGSSTVKIFKSIFLKTSQHESAQKHLQLFVFQVENAKNFGEDPLNSSM
jgi:hypothetical protein